MKKHILVAILILTLIGIAYCAARTDFAFSLSFSIGTLGCVIKIMEEHKKGESKKDSKNKKKVKVDTDNKDDE